MNIMIIVMWIPTHRGIKGSEKVDSLAKQALKNEEVMNISLSKYEAKAVIKTYTTKKWQHKWDTVKAGHHLYEIQREVGVVKITKISITEENILTRLRVGRTKLNKTLKIINKHPTGLCEHCGVEESVEHVICVCQKYTNEREIMRN